MMNEKKNLLNNIPNIYNNNSGVRVFGCGVKNVKAQQKTITTLNTVTKTPYNQYIRKEGGR